MSHETLVQKEIQSQSQEEMNTNWTPHWLFWNSLTHLILTTVLCGIYSNPFFIIQEIGAQRGELLVNRTGILIFCLSVQFSLVTQLCLTLCNPMDCRVPGFPVHHQLPELTQTQVHWVSNAIQPSHPLPFPSPAFIFPSIRVFSKESGLCQSIGVSASASVLPINIQDSFLLGWTGWISLQSKGLSRVFSNTTVQKYQFFDTQLSLWFNSHIRTWDGKTIALTRETFLGKVMSLLFNMLSRLVTAFLPRSKCLLISWLQSPSAMILEPPKIKSLTVSIAFPSICYGTGYHDLSFLNVEF